MGFVGIHKEEVANHIRIEHMNAYGLRKGSATLAVSSTTTLTPISSNTRREEWSMGKILDVYWHFSEPGDHYLGRILVGMDPKRASVWGSNSSLDINKSNRKRGYCACNELAV